MFYQGSGAAQVSHAPARHGMALGEAIDHNGPLVHIGNVGDRDVVLAIGELGVDFVGDHHDVGTPENLCNSL